MQKARVLVVDDNEAGRYAVVHWLRQAGHEVIEAGSSAECFASLASRKPDLILLDINLPDINGIETCRRIKANSETARIPIIQVSAHLTLSEHRIEGLESGADVYLPAPFEARELLAHVSHLLRLHDVEERLRQALELNPQMPWTGNPDGEIEELSERWSNFTGYPIRELLGSGWSKASHPDDLLRLRSAWMLSVNSGEPFDLEHRIKTAAGTYRWMHSRAYPQRSSEGKILRWYGFTEDIQERVSAQRSLHDHENLLASIYSGVESAISVSEVLENGERFRMLSVNRACVEWTGIPLDRWVGKGPEELVPPPDAETICSHYREAVRTGKSISYEECLEFPAKKTWALTTVSPLRDESGKITRLVATSTDITQQKLTEAALKMAARLPAENPDGVLRLSGGRALDYANSPGKALIEKLAGGQDGLPAALVEPAVAALQSGKRMECEILCDEKTYLVNFAPIVETGYVNLYARDITAGKRAENALRDSEERFRSLADGTPIMVWVHDKHGELKFVNRGWCDFFGITLSEAQGRSWKPLVHPEDVHGYVDVFLKCHEERRHFHAQARVRRHDGQWRWIVSVAAPRFSGTGEYLGMAGSSVDITERKEAEAALARAKEDLESRVAERTASLQELVTDLEHFSYSITHDMRAPLRAMQGFAELTAESLEQGNFDEVKEFLRRIKVSAARMDLLITDSLNYSRTIQSELPLKPVNVGALLGGMQDTYPSLQPDNLEMVVDANIPPVMGNEAGLTQCFSNLLSNAIKFCKPGTRPRARIWGETRETWVRLWVEDEGVGISKGMLPRVFNMFARGAHPQAGTGIGLALVRKIVDRMGGRVGVESEQGEGSSFWIELKRGDRPRSHRYARVCEDKTLLTTGSV